MDQHHLKHNKPTAPPPPSQTKSSDNPPPYESVNTSPSKQNSVISTLIQAACAGGNTEQDSNNATAKTTVTRTVSDHSIQSDDNLGTLEQDDDGWLKVKGSNDNKSTAEIKRDFRKPNTTVIPDDSYILVAMTVPGLKLKKFSLRKTPANCNVTKSQFINHNTVRIEFVLSGKSGDIVYKFDNVDKPFKSDVTEEGSTIKFDVDKIRWKIRKV